MGIRVLKGLGWTFGAIVGLLVVVQVVLATGLATSLVNKFAARYVDGELTFGKVSANTFSRFPAISLTLKDATLTYPHERFDSIERSRPDIRLLAKGRGEQKDTLASFNELTVAVNPFPLIWGNVHVCKVILDGPRAFAKYYDENTANWDIFKFGSDKEKDDSSSFTVKDIEVRKVALTGNPDISFCDLKDTLTAALKMKEMVLSGKLSTEDLLGCDAKFHIDSLLVAGRLKGDTLFFGLDRLALKEKDRKASFDLDAHAYARTRAFGRFQVPISVMARAEFPEDSVLSVNVRRMHADIAGIPFEAKGEARLHSDRYFIDAEAAIDGFDLNNALRNYVENVWDGAKDITTNSKLTLTALAQGYYSKELGLMPDLAAQLIVPSSYVSHKGLGVKGNIDLDIEAEAVADQPVNAKVNRLHADIPGLAANAIGTGDDLLGKDPVFFVDLDLSAQLDSLVRLLPKEKGYHAEGGLEACLYGKVRKSQMNMAKISRANLTGLLESDGLWAASEKDTLEAYLGGVEMELAAKGNKIDDSVEKGARMLAVLMDVDTLSADYKTMALKGKTFHLMAQNSADILDEKKKASFYPFCGEVSAAGLVLRDVDSSVVAIRNTKNSFRISPKSDNASVPVLRLSSHNEKAFLRSSSNRVGVQELNLDATAVMNTLERKLKFKAMQDSLARVYPDVPRDSLFRYAMSKRATQTEEWMTEEDFKKSDINISLSEDMKKYYREWDLSGIIKLGNATLSTPYFPLKNSVENLSGSFTNDRVDLKSVTFRSGQSDISAKGSLWGLRRALLRNGTIYLDMDITSEVLQVNELLGAYDAGRKVSEKQLEKMAEMDDDAYAQACQKDIDVNDSTVSSLIVVPGNVNAKLNLEAAEIFYSTLYIDWMESEIAMKERCLQITNTVATSNMGDIYFEGFYSTRTKKNLKTGFWVNLVDITAEKVIDLVPQIDTIMPLLKSFSGLLDCTLAATTSLDENMNILMPTVNGVTRITGKNLVIDDDQTISKIAKVLMFRNKKTVHVDKMSVEGLLQDSKLEVFPFLLNVDRYKVALSGIQNMDSSFKYHVSVIKSPIWFKFGIDLFGDFDDWKWKLGRAKYRNAKKVPAFTKVIDQSTKNLTNSIHTIFEKGVDAAIAENESQQAIADYKASTNYVQAVDQPLDTLSGRDAKELEKIEKMEDGVEALGLDLDTLSPESFDALDDETKSKLKDLGVTREWLVKREAEDESGDDSDEATE